jgi:hypothetical protein
MDIEPSCAVFFKESVEPMKRTHSLTAIIEREDDLYVALCPELDIASQGASLESARLNLVEALELFLKRLGRRK